MDPNVGAFLIFNIFLEIITCKIMKPSKNDELEKSLYVRSLTVR